MKFLIRAIVVIVGLMVLMVAIGFVLPAHFKVQRSIDIAAPAATVYPLIAAPAAWKNWSEWNRRDPQMKITYAGPAAGIGAGWRWESATEGNGEMTFTQAVPEQRLDYTLKFPDVGMASTGQFLIEPAAAGVRVTWTNEGAMDRNPINRWFGLFMDRLVGPDFEAGLANLKALAEKR
jgi:uncharacterized protein YndB with AHSA1/START domain